MMVLVVDAISKTIYRQVVVRWVVSQKALQEPYGRGMETILL